MACGGALRTEHAQCAAEGLQRLEKTNGSTVEPDSTGRHLFAELVAARKLSVYRLT